MVAGLLVEHRPWPHGALPDSRFSVLLRCKHVYAASGAIHTPALLLQSGEGRGGPVRMRKSVCARLSAVSAQSLPLRAPAAPQASTDGATWGPTYTCTRPRSCGGR